MTFLSQLDWRFATKVFDTEKKLSSEHLSEIQRAIQKAPSALGLQPYHILLLSDATLREKVKAAAWNQAQVSDASHLFIFCARTDVSERITSIISILSGGNAEIEATLGGYKDMMTGFASERSSEQLASWTARQTYIALGFGLAACAELGIDACPMEGFDPQAVHAVLELPEHVVPVAFMAVGYRKEGPERPKFRFSQEDLFTIK